MAKIYPNLSINNSSSEREKFTIWMKSLVCHSNGCTVFNSKGEVVFRVDNYQERCSSRVFLMDSKGQVLYSIRRKKFSVFGCWEGFKWIDSKEIRPCFQVTRDHTFWSKNRSCRVTINGDENCENCFRIVGSEGKSTLKIVDFSGQLLAEAVEKQSSGVSLGADVLTLTVEPQADRSLIMALIIVYGLINNKL